jgi:hypothetical protein
MEKTRAFGGFDPARLRAEIQSKQSEFDPQRLKEELRTGRPQQQQPQQQPQPLPSSLDVATGSTLMGQIEMAQKAQAEAITADPFGWRSAFDNPVAQFIGSTGSSITELFGASVSPNVAAFRAARPDLGLASQLLGPGGVYGAAFKVSRMAKAATVLEAGTARIAGMLGAESAATAPIRTQFVKEILRYSPLEAARLGTGYTLYPENFGNLLSDVAVNTTIAGVGGAIGGFFRSSGQVTKTSWGGVIGEEFGLLPSFKLRAALAPEAVFVGNMDKAVYLDGLRKEALEGLPGMKQRLGGAVINRFVQPVENATPKLDNLLNSLFRPTPKGGKGAAAREIKLLTEGAETDLRTVNAGQQAQFANMLGFDTADEMLSNVVYARAIQLKSPRFAADFAKTLEGSGDAFKQVAPGLLVGQEKDGLLVFLKRLSAAPKTRKYGEAAIGNKDLWVIGKTDNLKKLAPEAEKLYSANVEQWAKLREPLRKLGSGDVFNQLYDEVQAVFNPIDWHTSRKYNKAQMKEMVAGKLAERFKTTIGGVDSEVLARMADSMADVLKPTQFKESADIGFGRMHALLKAGMSKADELAQELMYGKIDSIGPLGGTIVGKGVVRGKGIDELDSVKNLWESLGDADRQMVALAAQTQTPAEDLGKLLGSAEIGDTVKEAVKGLQAINARVMEKYVKPSLEAAGLTDEFQWLDGYIMPRLFKGSFQARVEDAAGNLKYLASGVTGKSAQDQAREIVETVGKDTGLSWKVGPVESFGIKSKLGDKNATTMDEISEMLTEYMTNNKSEQDVVKSALVKIERRRLASTSAAGLPTSRPGFAKARTGVAGSPDNTAYSLAEVMEATGNHYKQMLRLSSFVTWKSRFGQEALLLKGSNPTAYDDLVRKAGLTLGLEGELTSWLNKTISPLLGGALGPRAASKIAGTANATLHLWTLGIVNPVHALLNILTPVQNMLPFISLVSGASDARLASILQFTPKMGADGLARGSVGVIDHFKLLGKGFSQMHVEKRSASHTEVLKRLTQDGSLNPQLYEDWAGSSANVGDSLAEVYRSKGPLRFVAHLSTFMTEKSDQYARMVSANMAFELGESYLKLKDEQLFRFVKRSIEVTNYGYATGDRARIMTGPIGSQFGLFKNWQMHFMGNMVRYAKLGKEEGVWGPLLWQTLSATALGGLGATAIRPIADGFARNLTESPTAFQWLHESLAGVDDPVSGNKAADIAYFGLPAFFGASLQGSSTLPGTNVANDVRQLSSFVFWERAKQIGKLVNDAEAYRDATGMAAMSNQNLRDQAIAALAPRAIARAVSSAEGQYIKSMRTGYASVQDVSAANRLLYGLGFNPVDIERNLVAQRELQVQVDKRKETLQGLGMEYSQAQIAQDWQHTTDVLKKATMLGIDPAAVIQSGLTRSRREGGDNFDKYPDDLVRKYTDFIKE